jgi:hypothetical protein
MIIFLSALLNTHSGALESMGVVLLYISTIFSHIFAYFRIFSHIFAYFLQLDK